MLFLFSFLTTLTFVALVSSAPPPAMTAVSNSTVQADTTADNDEYCSSWHDVDWYPEYKEWKSTQSGNTDKRSEMLIDDECRQNSIREVQGSENTDNIDALPEANVCDMAAIAFNTYCTDRHLSEGAYTACAAICFSGCLEMAHGMEED